MIEARPSAGRRARQSSRPPIVDIYYGTFHAIKNAKPEDAREHGHGADRTVGLRQVDVLARAQPDARSHARRARRPARSLLDGLDIYAPDADPVMIRHRIGMVFQRPNPFPKTIFENVVYGPKIHGERTKTKLARSPRDRCGKRRCGTKSKTGSIARRSISRAVSSSACASRACLAVEPEVILMDEPASALDPIATSKIEDLIGELKKDYTVVIVTHSMQQAARISDIHRVLPSGRDRRSRHDEPNLHQAARKTHRRLHHRPLRLSLTWLWGGRVHPGTHLAPASAVTAG